MFYHPFEIRVETVVGTPLSTTVTSVLDLVVQHATWDVKMVMLPNIELDANLFNILKTH